MQRIIKFRAWDKIRKVIVSNNSLSRNIKTSDECQTWETDEYDWGGGIFRKRTSFGDNLEIMQFTGLKDKNGVEIYESDILEWIEEPTNPNTFHEVCWIEKEGCWGTKDGIWLCNTNMNYKVIGNKFENSELLKGEK